MISHLGTWHAPLRSWNQSMISPICSPALRYKLNDSDTIRGDTSINNSFFMRTSGDSSMVLFHRQISKGFVFPQELGGWPTKMKGGLSDSRSKKKMESYVLAHFSGSPSHITWFTCISAQSLNESWMTIAHSQPGLAWHSRLPPRRDWGQSLASRASQVSLRRLSSAEIAWVGRALGRAELLGLGPLF